MLSWPRVFRVVVGRSFNRIASAYELQHVRNHVRRWHRAMVLPQAAHISLLLWYPHLFQC
jgi:hypothetical protein